MKIGNSRTLVVVGTVVGLSLLVLILVLTNVGPYSSASSPFSPVYSNTPLVGQNQFALDSGTVVSNGYAYSYLTIDLTKLAPGSHFIFLPSLNSKLGDGITLQEINVTSTGEFAIGNGIQLSWRINIPYSNSTITMSSTVNQREISTGVASIGNYGTYIYLQPTWVNSQTVKVFFYVGPAGMPQAPSS